MANGCRRNITGVLGDDDEFAALEIEPQERQPARKKREPQQRRTFQVRVDRTELAGVGERAELNVSGRFGDPGRGATSAGHLQGRPGWQAESLGVSRVEDGADGVAGVEDECDGLAVDVGWDVDSLVDDMHRDRGHLLISPWTYWLASQSEWEAVCAPAAPRWCHAHSHRKLTSVSIHAPTEVGSEMPG